MISAAERQGRMSPEEIAFSALGANLWPPMATVSQFTVSRAVMECVKFVVDPVTVIVDVPGGVPVTVPPPMRPPPQLTVISTNISDRVTQITAF